MTDEGTPTPPNGFTAKEMWVRVDGKLDAVLAKQNHYDVELALVKARQEEQDRDIKEIKKGQVNLTGALRWAAATVIAIGILSDAIIRFFK